MGMRYSKVLGGGTLIMEKKIDRYESMNNHKKNEGFSLVELIVVVLIMAIIATALTLAVTKYVSKAKRAADANTAGELKSALMMALVDGMTGASNAAFEIPEGSVYISFNTRDMEFVNDSSNPNPMSDADLEILTKIAKEALGEDPIKSKVHSSDYFKLTIAKTDLNTVDIICTYLDHDTEDPLKISY